MGFSRAGCSTLCDFMIVHFSTSTPMNEFGMGVIPSMETQPGSRTERPLWWMAVLNHEVQQCHCFLPHLLTCPFLSLLPYLNSFFFSVWWIGFQLLCVSAISHRSCPIVLQRWNTCGDTDHSRDRHFRATGLWCMQRKTSNGGRASDSYWWGSVSPSRQTAQTGSTEKCNCNAQQHWN